MLSTTMLSLISPLLLLLPLSRCIPITTTTTTTLSQSPPQDATLINNQLTAFSIEFKDFPLFAGTRTNPNQFSINLLQNLAQLSGSMPVIRVGGSSQDDVIFISTQSTPVITFPAIGANRSIVTIGPSFFDSFNTFPSTSYIAGLNLATNSTNGTTTRLAETSYICRALGTQLLQFEIGNEPDLFPHWNRRPLSWGAKDYVTEWQAANTLVQEELLKSCPLLAGKIGTRFFAPSFAGTDVNTPPTTLGPLQAFQNGLNAKSDITVLSGHNYMAAADSTSTTQLQSVLMNHTAIVDTIASHVTLSQELRPFVAPGTPYTMGETNSLSGGGAVGLSNTFGAALWVVDFTLWQAVQGFQRVHFHQSGTAPYSAWAPSTNPPTANAPYYGNVAAAAAVGSVPGSRIAWLDVGDGDDRISAYGVYEGLFLKRIVVLNMVEYVSTSGTARLGRTFEFVAPWGVKGGSVQRLMAAGAEVTSGVTFGGVSYDYGLAEGKGVVVNQTAVEERVEVGRDGSLSVVVWDSEGVVLNLS